MTGLLENYLGEWVELNPDLVSEYMDAVHHLTSVERLPTYIRVESVSGEKVETKSLYSKEQAHRLTRREVEFGDTNFVLVEETWDEYTFHHIASEGFLEPVDELPEYVSEN